MKVQAGPRRGEVILGFTPRLGGEEWPADPVPTVTPQQAAEILKSMPANRRLILSHVEALALDIAEEHFKVTGQCASFDENGLLLDGQHRFEGCVAANRPFRIGAMFNVQSSAFDVIDRNVIKNLAHDLDRMGYGGADPKLSTVLSAVLRVIVAHDIGLWPRLLGQKVRLRPALVQGTVARHEMVLDTNKRLYSRTVRKSARMPRAPFVAAISLFREVDDELALKYAEQLITHDRLGTGDPAFAVYRAQENEKARGVALSSALLMRLVRGWNALHEQRDLKRVNMAPSDTSFPAISGYAARASRKALRAAA